MDISNTNPSAHADQEAFPIGGGAFMNLPQVAKGQSVTAAARKLARGLELSDDVLLRVPEEEAMAIATATVDPTQLRLDVERRRVSMHRTPSGHVLVSVLVRVWASGVSCDGANGRGRTEARLAGEAVWPHPGSVGGEPSMRYTTRSIDRMREAVRANAHRIASPDMRLRLRDHADGVWNPIYLVAGRLIVQSTAEGDVESEAAFVHTAEGSTRLVTCQEGLDLDRDLPLSFAGNTLDLVRRARAYVAGRLAVSPSSSDVHHAVKVATLPAHIIIGVLGPDGLPATTAFPEVISEFVQSIHEEPRPWNAIAQGGVRGERLVLDLADGGFLTDEQAIDVVGRNDHYEVTRAPNVIAGRLLRATSHPNARPIVRSAILQDPSRQRWSGNRYAQTVGPLLLGIYREVPGRQKNVVAALTQEFQPPALGGTGWSVREDHSVRDLLDEALAHLQESPGTVSDAAVELCARSLGGLASLGLVYSDQGSQVNDESWLRGTVAQVLSKLMVCTGGLKILCEAAERAEDSSKLMPHLYEADGEAVLDADGNPLHLHPDQGANVHLRELAFRERKPDKEDEEEPGERSPFDRFVDAQKRTSDIAGQLTQLVEDLFEIRDSDGQALIEKHGLDRSIMGELPAGMSELRDLVLVSLADDKANDDGDEHDPEDLEAIEDALMGDEPSFDVQETAA
jgi:hypothetical protein